MPPHSAQRARNLFKRFKSFLNREVLQKCQYDSRNITGQGFGALWEVAPLFLAGSRLQKLTFAIWDLRTFIRCVSYILGPYSYMLCMGHQNGTLACKDFPYIREVVFSGFRNDVENGYVIGRKEEVYG